MASKALQGWIQEGNGISILRKPIRVWSRFRVELLKALAFINGGAAVAILAYLGNPASRGGSGRLSDMTWALVSFAAGVFFTVVALIVGYLTQLQLYNEDIRKSEQQAIGKAEVPRRFQSIIAGFFELEFY
jgi:hypothetical protein